MSAPTAGLAASLLVAKTNAKDYSNRQGYDEKFLGTKFAVPLPAMSKPTKDQIAEVRGARRAGVLDYTHFSVMLNKSRKMCFYAVVNIDGKRTKGLSKSHTWILDPRVDADLQAGPKVYEKNDLDRGHMVRRLDPVWGDAFQIGNSDTFHFPNACPQIHKFNDGIWGELEDYLLKNADVKDLKLTVFTGPIFGKDDRSYREIQIPSRYWKVAVMVSGSGSKMKLAAAGFMLSQDDLLISFEFPLGPIPKKVTQVSIKEIEKLTGMKFGAATKADFLAKKVAAAGVSFDLEPPVMELHSLDQIVIPRK